MQAAKNDVVTEILPVSEAALAEAARLISAGELVAVPTETVYGLAADAANPDAVAKIYAAKGRPSFNPLIVHVQDITQAKQSGALPSEAATLAAETYWPGPLTIVVPLDPVHRFAPAIAAGLQTVAIRSPDHPIFRSLLARTARPLAAPSANASGTVSPTSADHVLRTLNGRVPLILDGGAAQRGIESTILAITESEVRQLRPGPIDVHEVAVLVGLPVAEPGPSGPIQAPGQLESHYAPSKAVRLDAVAAEPGEWLIGFGQVLGDDTLSPSGDLDAAAARLFAALHWADAQPVARIAVAPIPRIGVGVAINDRLCRAAAPRS